MKYQLPCSCGIVHEVTTSQAGQDLSCTCGASISVPTLRGLRELTPVATSSSPKPTADASSKIQVASVIIGLMFAIIFVAIPTTIFFGYQRFSMDTSLTREVDAKMAAEGLANASPLELSELWEQYSTTSLTNQVEPPFATVQRFARELEWKTGVSAVVVMAAAIIAAAAATARRNSVG